MSNLESAQPLDALREPLQPVNLCQLVVNLADDFQPLAWDKDVQIRVQNEVFGKAPEVLVIRPLISQVFTNIIENAVKYSKKASEISISGRYNQEIDAVTVVVRNHGIPLTAGDEKRVFERGYRTDAARNLYPAGTGFGLYIAHRIVESHEGVITASMDSRGYVSFSISLPVKALAGKAREREPKNRPAGR